MERKRFLLGMLAIVLVFGAASAAWADDPLNGTWTDVEGSQILFSDGDFIISVPGEDTGEYRMKGTYTAQNGTITWQITQIDENLMEEMGIDVSPGFYTIDQLKEAIIKEYEDSLGVLSLDAPIDEILKALDLSLPEATYSVDGDTLTMNMLGEIEVFTREN